jgi:hypothetical protein
MVEAPKPTYLCRQLLKKSIQQLWKFQSMKMGKAPSTSPPL